MLPAIDCIAKLVTVNFELNSLRRRFSDDDLLEDLRRVARLSGSQGVRQSYYNEYGQYDSGTVSRRFGSWAAALERAGLIPQQSLRSAHLVADLQSVSNQLGRNYVSTRDYTRFGRWSTWPFVRVFGNWRKALAAAGLEVHPNFNDRHSDETLFENIEAVWIALGRQPRYSEIAKPLSQFTVSTYERRFGGWRAALQRFVEWVNEDSSAKQIKPVQMPESSPVSMSLPSAKSPRARRTSRAPNLRLRFLVMQRDNFSCRYCGRTPALHAGLVLHVDHVVSWEKGGETELSNLQTLCEPCNLGKSNIL